MIDRKYKRAFSTIFNKPRIKQYDRRTNRNFRQSKQLKSN